MIAAARLSAAHAGGDNRDNSIVFIGGSDPIETGLVARYSRRTVKSRRILFESTGQVDSKMRSRACFS